MGLALYQDYEAALNYRGARLMTDLAGLSVLRKRPDLVASCVTVGLYS